MKRARKEISDFDNLPKEDEFIYFNNDKVIKFFVDKELSKKRVLRTKKLKHFVPKINSYTDNFYSYDFVSANCYLSKLIFINILIFFYQIVKRIFGKKSN